MRRPTQTSSARWAWSSSKPRTTLALRDAGWRPRGTARRTRPNCGIGSRSPTPGRRTSPARAASCTRLCSPGSPSMRSRRRAGCSRRSAAGPSRGAAREGPSARGREGGVLRSVPMRLGTPRLPVWIALCAIAAAALVLPQVWASRFVTEFRAAVHLHKAQSRIASRKFVQARAELRAALRLRPDDAEARRQLAAMELGLGNWELAFLELETLTELHSEDPDGWIRLAELMGRRGWLEAPEAALDKALEAAPQRADAHAMRAEFRFRLGRYYGALIDAQAAIAGAAEGSENARSARRTMSRFALRAGGQTIAGEDLDAPPPAAPRRLRAEDQIDVGNLGAWTRERWPGRLGETRQALEAQLQKQSWTEAQRIVDS